MLPYSFVTEVVAAYNQNKGVFAKKINAEELIPNTLSSIDKALFIFYVLQLDYAMKSQILYMGANKLIREYPRFLDPLNIDSMSETKLEEYLKTYLRPRYINEAVRRYKFNTQKLLNFYKGDPRNIFSNVDSCAEVLRRLREFRGFGPKIGNFFVRTMINSFNFSFSDIEYVLPPVDVHDVRIAYYLGYVDSDKMTPKNIQKVKAIWNKACLDAGESWLIFDKALWLLGSEGRPKSKGDVFRLIGLSTD